MGVSITTSSTQVVISGTVGTSYGLLNTGEDCISIEFNGIGNGSTIYTIPANKVFYLIGWSFAANGSGLLSIGNNGKKYCGSYAYAGSNQNPVYCAPTPFAAGEVLTLNIAAGLGYGSIIGVLKNV